MHSPVMERVSAGRKRSLSGRKGRDALIVALALAVAVEATAKNIPSHILLLAIVLNALAIVALVIARRRPILAAAAATLVMVVLLKLPRGFADAAFDDAKVSLMPFCVLLVVLARLVIRRGLLFAAPLLVPFIVNAVRPLDGGQNRLPGLALLLLVLAALVVGESMRKRGQAVAALDASQEAMAESIRARTVMEERARIARELHDIVAHHLSVITIESEAARLTSPGLSADAGGRLEAIASTAREALTETRRLLGVLRENSGGEEAERTPQPGLGELGVLLDRARATGTPVRLIQKGKIARLPLSIDLAAYRIVQEALTNARRHAPGADVDVELAYREHALELRVRDYGPGTAGAGRVEGHGLMGMRERATLAGGSFSSGPAEGGGFEVDVTLPTTEPTR